MVIVLPVKFYLEVFSSPSAPTLKLRKRVLNIYEGKPR